MVQPGEVHEGMKVLTAEGHQLGWVTGIGDAHFEFEPTLVPIHQRDFLVDYQDVGSVRGGEVFLEPNARLELEEEDEGSALPPRGHGDMDREPVNAGESPSGV